MQRRQIISVLVAFTIPWIVVGQLSSASSTIYNYYSEEQDNPAWIKDIITADGPNYTNLRDRQRALVSKQETVALLVSISNVASVAQAYNEGFATGIQNLIAATNDMPTEGISIGLVMPLEPSETRTAFEGFIVAQEYDVTHNTDILTIHFTQSLAIQPKIVCPYVFDGGLTTNLVEGSFKDTNYAGSHWTNIYTIAMGEITYDNCHKLYVQRPASLSGYTGWFSSIVKWGTAKGIDYGNIVHTAFGEELFTGILTNEVNNTYVEIKDGAIIGSGFVSY